MTILMTMHTQSMNIRIQFSPRLDLASIHEEATQLAALATPPEDPKREKGQSTPTDQEGEEQPSPVCQQHAATLNLQRVSFQSQGSY